MDDDQFEKAEDKLPQEDKDKIVARLMVRDNSYWIYHKQLVDETIDNVLEKKPEEKIWRVVRETYCPELEFPAYRLKKRDLIKVGRVRFKIRDIMSPVYKEIQSRDDYHNAYYKQQFPS